MTGSAKHSNGRAVLGVLAMLVVAFCVGVIAGVRQPPDQMVWITDSLGFSPRQQPLLNGLFWIGNALVLVLAIALGAGVIRLLVRYNIFQEGAGALMLLIALTGLALCVFGPRVGLELDAGQRIVFGVIALVFGAFGVGMLRNARRLRMSARSDPDSNADATRVNHRGTDARTRR